MGVPDGSRVVATVGLMKPVHAAAAAEDGQNYILRPLEANAQGPSVIIHLITTIGPDPRRHGARVGIRGRSGVVQSGIPFCARSHAISGHRTDELAATLVFRNQARSRTSALPQAPPRNREKPQGVNLNGKWKCSFTFSIPNRKRAVSRNEGCGIVTPLCR